MVSSCTFKFFQNIKLEIPFTPTFLLSFTNPYVEDPRCTSRGWREEISLALFWKSKKVPWFWKKGRNCVHFLVESSIPNIFLRASNRKSSKFFSFFHAGPFFVCFDESLLKFLYSTKPLLPWKISGCVRGPLFPFILVLTMFSQLIFFQFSF